jgi:hypothetical protein
MRNLHQRPVIYNYSLRKIAAKLKASPTTIKTHIEKLERLGLITRKNGHLYFKSTQQFFRERTSPMVAVGIAGNKQQQIAYLRFPIFKRNLHTQYKKVNKKNNVLKMLQGDNLSYKATKAAMRQSKHLNLKTLESSLDTDFTLSNKKIGILTNRSTSTAIKIQKSFNNLGLIKSFKRVKLLFKGHNRRSFFELNLNGSYFLSTKGCIYQRLSNGLIIPDNGALV